MNNEIKELKDAIDIINDQITSLFAFEIAYTLKLEYSGFNYSVYFIGKCIWCEYEDEREYNEDINEYEPFLDYLIRTVNKEIENLSKIKLAKE